MTHGTRSAYRAGCRCLPCKQAMAQYAMRRYLERRQGRRLTYVDARAARRHLRKLQRRGVGKRQAARLSHLSTSLISAVRAGRFQRIRSETERRILAIRPCLSLGAIVEAATTKRLIAKLKAEGFDARTIAERVGDVHHQRVRVRTALRVRRLHRVVMTGAE